MTYKLDDVISDPVYCFPYEDSKFVIYYLNNDEDGSRLFIDVTTNRTSLYKKGLHKLPQVEASEDLLMQARFDYIRLRGGIE